MRVLITGHQGLLGRALVEALRAEHEVVGLSRTASLPHMVGDITDEPGTIERIRVVEPDVVIHAAAMKDVDACEQDPAMAHRVNAIGTRNVAIGCQAVSAAMVYISTDYVFDGAAGRAYDVTDVTSPLNVYGIAKRSGERYVSYLLEEFFIIRTCALFGIGGRHFAGELLGVPSGGEAYGLTDQIGSPSYAPDVAEAIRALLRVASEESACVRKDYPVYGIYHVVNEGACSRYEFAETVLRAAGRKDVRLRQTTCGQDRRPAKRPANTSLSTSRFTRVTGHRMRSWKEAVTAYVAATTAENRQPAR